MAETNKKIISYLPLEVISHILSLLPIEDILRCRAVCKAWFRLTKEPFFVNLQLAATGFQRDRIILIPNSMSIYLLDTERKNVREICLRTIIKGWEIWHLSIMSACLGFLCIASHRYPDPVIVCNPVTKHYIILPAADPCVFPFVHAALGYDPSSTMYKVVKLYRDNNSGLSKGLILTLGETSWRPLDLTYTVLSRINVFPRYNHGSLYWMIDKIVHLDGNGFILVLDLSTEKFHIISFPESIRFPRYSRGSQWSKNFYLVTAGNCIMLTENEDRLMHLWSIKRKSDGDFSVRYFRVEMYSRWNVFSRPVCIGTMDGCILLEVTKFGMNEERDLVLYCPRRRQYISSQIKGLPAWFRSQTFRPNLLPPYVALSGSARALRGTSKGPVLDVRRRRKMVNTMFSNVVQRF